jgi:two-component sensor histidine kinase
LYDALENALITNDEKLLSTVYHTLGAAYNWTNKYFSEGTRTALNDSFYIWADNAILYDLKAVELRRKHNIRGLHNSLNNLGMAYYKKALVTGIGFEESKAAHKEAREIRIKNNDLKGLVSSNINLATIALENDVIDTAKYYLHISKFLSEKLDYALQKTVVYEKLNKLYEDIGRHDSALFYYKKFTRVKQETANNEYKQGIKELETKYDVAGKEKEIALAAQEVKIQRIFLIISLVFLMLMAVAIFIYYRLYIKNKLLSNRNALLIREQNHRVKNNLQLISTLLSLQAKHLPNEVAKQAIEDSQLRIETVGMIQRKLYGDNTVEINLNEFIMELVDAVADLFNPKRNVNTYLDVESVWLSVEKAVPLGLIINELLTNSFKYAFPEQDSPALKIEAKKIYNKIHFVYSDNGSGFSPGEMQNRNTFGLKLIQLQTQQLNANSVWERNGEMVFKTEFTF